MGFTTCVKQELSHMNNYPSLYFRQKVGRRSVFASVFLPSLLYYILSVYIALHWQVYAVLQGAFHAVHRLTWDV